MGADDRHHDDEEGETREAEHGIEAVGARPDPSAAATTATASAHGLAPNGALGWVTPVASRGARKVTGVAGIAAYRALLGRLGLIEVAVATNGSASWPTRRGWRAR